MIPIDDYQGTLSVTNLPNIVRFPNHLIAHSLATNNWSIDNNNLLIVVEPIEAQSDKSKSQIWFINYGKEHFRFTEK